MRSAFTFCGRTFTSSSASSSPSAAKSRDADRQEPQNQREKPSAQPQQHWGDILSTDKVMDRLSAVEQVSSEVIPYMAPKMSVACPILLGTCTGYDIYSSCRQEYDKSKDMPPRERYRHLATKAGDATITNTLSAVAIPTLMARHVHRMVGQALTNPRVPAMVARQPNVATAAVLVTAALVTAKPVNMMVDTVMDWTYRPFFNNKKADKAEE